MSKLSTPLLRIAELVDTYEKLESFHKYMHATNEIEAVTTASRTLDVPTGIKETLRDRMIAAIDALALDITNELNRSAESHVAFVDSLVTSPMPGLGCKKRDGLGREVDQDSTDE